MSKEPRFLSIDRAAKLAGYSSRQLARFVEREQIRSFYVLEKRFILATDFDAWVQDRGIKLEKANSGSGV